MNETSFGERLKTAMTMARITRQMLAKTCGVAGATVAKWEKMQEADLAAKHLVSVAGVVKCRAVWLASGRGLMSLYIPMSTSMEDISQIVDKLPINRLAVWIRLGQLLTNEAGEHDWW